jgi:hypothetical protein
VPSLANLRESKSPAPRKGTHHDHDVVSDWWVPGSARFLEVLMAKQERIEPGFFYTRAELCAKGDHRWEIAAWTNVSTFRVIDLWWLPPSCAATAAPGASAGGSQPPMTTREELMRDTENTSCSR